LITNFERICDQCRLGQQNGPASSDHSAGFFEGNLKTRWSMHPFFKKVLKPARKRLFKDILTRNLRGAFFST
jgi:hypothetical protein